MTYRDKIRNAYDTLSPSFKLLAEFILDNTYGAAFLNASQLAKRLKVDPATVVRFAQRLAYPGYPELLKEIRDEVQGDLSRYTTTPSYSTEPSSVVMAAVRREINNLELMERGLRPADINQLVEGLLNAKHIILLGEGVSRELARLFAYQLNTLALPVRDIDVDPASVAGAFRTVGEGDVVIGISATSICQDVAHAMRLAQKHGALTINISGAMAWPASIAADMVLASQNESAIQTPDYPALSVMLSAIFQALWIARQGEQVALNERFESLLEDLTELRHDANVPRSPDLMTDKPADEGGE